MPRTDKVTTPQYEAFVADVLARHGDLVTTGSLFGMPCLKAAGKAFAGSYAGGLAVKLPPDARSDAMALDGAGPFDPSGKGRPMREWVVVPSTGSDHWDALAEAALSHLTAT